MKNEPDTNQQKAYLAAFLTPISFWGKVVDEKGNGVPAASVKLNANDNPNPMGSGSDYEKKTASDGSFAISGIHGIALSVEVSKPGYYPTKQSSGLVSYVIKGSSDIPVPTAYNPTIFVLKKKGEAAALLRVESSANVPKNGLPIELNLRTGKAVGVGLGDIEVECQIHDEGIDTTVYNPYDWQCRISVQGGGLTERMETLDFTAPEGGYRASDEIDMPKNATPWHPQLTKEYFVKLHDGTYARLQIRIVTGGSNYLRVTSYINPQTGSRNLEFDPTKQVKAP